MKNFLTSIALFLLTIGFVSAQDYTIVPQTLNPIITLGDTAIVKVTIRNLGSGGSYYTNSLMVTGTAPNNSKFVGFVNNSTYQSSPVWSIAFLGNESYGNTIRLENSGGSLGPAPFDPTNTTHVYLYLVSVQAMPNPEWFTFNVGFNAFPFDSLAQRSAQGNVDGNDNNNSSLKVNPGTPTPLDFLSINAKWQSENAIVDWKVAREQDNEYFVVERSFDGKIFTEAGRIKSVGNHEEALTYFYTDEGVRRKTKDNVIYRIKQVDFSGKNTTSKHATLQNDNFGSGVANLFPNPATSNVKFVYENYALVNSQNLKLRLMDLHGRILIEKTMTIENGKTEIQLDLSGLADGSYYLNYNNDANNIKGSLRMIKG